MPGFIGMDIGGVHGLAAGVNEVERRGRTVAGVVSRHGAVAGGGAYWSAMGRLALAQHAAGQLADKLVGRALLLESLSSEPPNWSYELLSCGATDSWLMRHGDALWETATADSRTVMARRRLLEDANDAGLPAALDAVDGEVAAAAGDQRLVGRAIAQGLALDTRWTEQWIEDSFGRVDHASLDPRPGTTGFLSATLADEEADVHGLAMLAGLVLTETHDGTTPASLHHEVGSARRGALTAISRNAELSGLVVADTSLLEAATRLSFLDDGAAGAAVLSVGLRWHETNKPLGAPDVTSRALAAVEPIAASTLPMMVVVADVLIDHPGDLQDVFVEPHLHPDHLPAHLNGGRLPTAPAVAEGGLLTSDQLDDLAHDVVHRQESAAYLIAGLTHQLDERPIAPEDQEATHYVAGAIARYASDVHDGAWDSALIDGVGVAGGAVAVVGGLSGGTAIAAVGVTLSVVGGVTSAVNLWSRATDEGSRRVDDIMIKVLQERAELERSQEPHINGQELGTAAEDDRKQAFAAGVDDTTGVDHEATREQADDLDRIADLAPAGR